MYCRNCGRYLLDTQRYCPYCAASTTAQADSTYRYAARKTAPQSGEYRYVPQRQKPSQDGKHAANTGPQKAPAQKKKSGGFWTLITWAFILWCLSLSFSYEEAKRPAAAEDPTAAAAVWEATQETAWQERLPSVPAGMEEHMLLQSRRTGACETLEGKVGITLIFVDDAESRWTQAEMDAYRTQIDYAVNQLLAEAWGWGVNPSIIIQQDHCAISGSVDSSNAVSYMSAMLKASGRSARDDREALLGVEEAPVIFALNKGGRAFAQWSRPDIEFAMLFEDPTSFRHELYHLFGAQDFYYQQELAELTRTWLGSSVMLDSGEGRVDELTAYLIGWTDTLSDNAVCFLRGVSAIGAEELDSAKRANSFTGVGTRTYENGSTYEGDLVFGVPHGWGIIRWSNGDLYEGNFQNGVQSGYGIQIWSDGTRYEGDFLDGRLHGWGAVTYPDGSVQNGCWENGEFVA